MATLLIHDSELVWHRNQLILLSVALAVAATGLVLGVLTPAICLFSVVLVLLAYCFGTIDAWPLPFLMANVLVAGMVLGPGAYSLDGWLFGRKKLRIGHLSKLP